MIYDELFDWQKDLVHNLKEKRLYGLWLDCGMGKTPVSLALAELNDCEKVMIVTINSKTTETEDDPFSWLWWAKKSKIKYNLFNKKTSPLKLLSEEPSVFVTNYESLFNRSKDRIKVIDLKSPIRNFIKSCKGKKFALIVDESHKMKNLQSHQTKAINQIMTFAKISASQVYAYLLTGTPFTQGYIDLYSQLKFLGCPMTKTDFIDNFCVKGKIRGLLEWQQLIVGYKNLDDLYKLVHQYAVTIKSDGLVSLPDQIFQYHELPITKEFNLLTRERLPAKMLKSELIDRGLDPDLVKDTITKQPNLFYRNLDYPDTKWWADTNGALWLRARQISIGFQGNSEDSLWYNKSRLTCLKKLLMENEDNYVIFYNFTPELIEIYDICEMLGYNIDVFCGEVKSLIHYKKFHELSAEKKLTNKKNVIIANFASGSTGMNWQDYNKCVLFSLPLFLHWDQSLKRIHRIGQKSTVIYHIFYQNNWCDLGMKEALNDGIEYTEDLFTKGLTEHEEDTI